MSINPNKSKIVSEFDEFIRLIGEVDGEHKASKLDEGFLEERKEKAIKIKGRALELFNKLSEYLDKTPKEDRIFSKRDETNVSNSEMDVNTFAKRRFSDNPTHLYWHPDECRIETSRRIKISYLTLIVPLAMTILTGLSFVYNRYIKPLAGRVTPNAQNSIRTGFNPDKRGKDSYTQLHDAVIDGDIDFVNNLIKSSAKLDIKNQFGETPLSIACQNSNTEIVKTLIEKGADPFIEDNEKKMPIDYARESNNKEIFDFLIARPGVRKKLQLIDVNREFWENQRKRK
ncbi:MAG: ankyrin repeat domain-containing protein [Waddliaceae bacterium]